VLVLARRVLAQAVRDGASEIHFELVHGGGTVRQRVDGIMHVQVRLPLGPFGRLLACVKAMAGLAAGPHPRARNGRIALEVDGNAVELLLAFMPFHDAEKCVVRLPSQGAHRMLGREELSERDLRAVRAMIEPGQGIVLVAGPLGSGRTTTLYAFMAGLQAEHRRIHTIEDPIEVRLEGIEQVQVDPGQGMTFAEAISRALRADPDVIMVGDLHEPASAKLAVQAGMTGHLVIAGMLSDDAAMAIGRLGEMGVERPAVAAAVRGAIAQRLMRRVCTACAEKVATPNEAEQRLVRLYGVTPVVRAQGCPECGQTGYRGRVAIHEVLALTPALRELVACGASTAELRAAAVEAGMRALRAAALQRVLEGITTLQEVERVVSGEPKSNAPAPGMPRVLVVDDEPVCRMAARRQLEANGFEVAECATGEEALVRLRVDDHIALVVLDLGLPGLQGDDVLRELRLSPATASLPVVVLTGSPDPDLEERIIEQGADDYLHKPLEPRRFITRIRAALRRAAA
jgi:type IV pilus assembly protein PilB